MVGISTLVFNSTLLNQATMNHLLSSFKGILALAFLFFAQSSFAQNALDFDGTDDQVTVPNASNLIANASGISLGFWVYPTTSSTGWPDFDGYAGFRNDVNADFYILQLGSNNVEARLRNSSGSVYTITYNSSLNLNTWNHLVLTYDGTTLSLYHDGAFAASTPASGSISNTSEALNIGYTPFTGNNFYFDGQLDDLGLWSRALSSSDVATLYNACGPDLSDATLELSYDFNQGTAGGSNGSISSLTDGKGNINGNLSGFALSGGSSNFVTSPLQGIANLNLTINSCGPYTAPNGQTYTSSGFYTDTIIPATGCDTIMDLNLTVTDLDSSATRIASNKLEANESDTNAQYQWLNCNSNYSKIVGATGRQFTFVQNGSYAVEVSLNNCVDTSACLVITNVGLAENQNSFRVYPNPASNRVKIEYPAGSAEEYEIQSLSGHIVQTGKLEQNGKTEISIKDLASGLYLLRLKGSAGMQVERLKVE